MTGPAVQVTDNGAGKSTTIKILCTLADPTPGAARVAGTTVHGHFLGGVHCLGPEFSFLR